jgi:uncharacterized protein (DUF433 family)
MPTVSDTHIRLDENNVAWIDDTNIKVVEIALERIAHGSSPEEICDQHNGYLTLGQIHAALAHYYDHQAEYDRQIEEQVREFDSRQKSAADSPGRRRLRAMGKLP